MKYKYISDYISNTGFVSPINGINTNEVQEITRNTSGKYVNSLEYNFPYMIQECSEYKIYIGSRYI